jgi:hypothetical protein
MTQDDWADTPLGQYLKRTTKSERQRRTGEILSRPEADAAADNVEKHQTERTAAPHREDPPPAPRPPLNEYGTRSTPSPSLESRQLTAPSGLNADSARSSAKAASRNSTSQPREEQRPPRSMLKAERSEAPGVPHASTPERSLWRDAFCALASSGSVQAERIGVKRAASLCADFANCAVREYRRRVTRRT